MSQHIHRAANTEIPAFLALKRKGYDVQWLVRDKKIVTGTNRRKIEFVAKKGEMSFSAYSVLELLGLIAMWEVRGNDWQKKSEEENPLAELLEFIDNDYQ